MTAHSKLAVRHVSWSAGIRLRSSWYAGLRGAGDLSWLVETDWRAFSDFEQKLHEQNGSARLSAESQDLAMHGKPVGCRSLVLSWDGRGAHLRVTIEQHRDKATIGV